MSDADPRPDGEVPEGGPPEQVVSVGDEVISPLDTFQGWLEHVRSEPFVPGVVFEPSQAEVKGPRELQQSRDRFFMSLAISEAFKSIERGPDETGIMDLPVGAVIARGNQLVSKGYTSNKRDRIGDRHAEVVAMSNAAYKIGAENGRPDDVLGECALYTMVEPCHMCHFTAWEQGVREVVAAITQQDLTNMFGTFSRKKKTASAIAEDSDHYIIPIRYDVMRDEVLEVLKLYRPSVRGGFEEATD